MLETQENYKFRDSDLFQKICGIGDSRLRLAEKFLNVKIIPRGLSLLFQGNAENIGKARNFFIQLEEELSTRPDTHTMDSDDFNEILDKKYDSINDSLDSDLSKDWTPKNKIFINFKGRPIFPRTFNQEKYVESLKSNFISFALGPAGTGKTFLSIAVACRMMQAGEIDRLILTRPAVEAGESLGFLPGDLAEKVNPYLRPIYDSLHECIGLEKTQEFIALGKIEIAPIAFMRGRTLSNSFIILDEAQNCTLPQLKMFLTRFGKNSRMSISGDITQIDLEHGRSGLEKVANLLQNSRGIDFVYFTDKDITRHPIVSIIVKKFEGMGL